MKQRKQLMRAGLLILAGAGALAACASSDRGATLSGGSAGSSEPMIVDQAMSDEAFFEAEEEMARAESAFNDSFDTGGGDDALRQSGPDFDQNMASQAQERQIIRSGSLSLVVEDTLATLEAIIQMADSMGGFVVFSETYQSGVDDSYFAELSIRVPSERFDEALGTLRGMAVKVNNESISGQDVTEEFIDLEARLGNLKSAEAQLQQIMEDAQDTDDVLNTFAQLTRIRGEIESIEGRLKYLSDSVALSNIHISLTPDIVTQPVEVNWRPLETVRRSLRALGRGLQGLGNVLIFLFVTMLPILLVIAVVLAPFFFAGRAMLRRRRRRRAGQGE